MRKNAGILVVLLALSCKSRSPDSAIKTDAINPSSSAPPSAVPFNYSNLKDLITSNNIVTATDLISRLPEEMKQNFVLLPYSASLQEGKPDTPRLLLYNSDASLALTFYATDPQSPKFFNVEVMRYFSEEKALDYIDIEFPMPPITVGSRAQFFEPPAHGQFVTNSTNPLITECVKCHGVGFKRADRNPFAIGRFEPYPYYVSSYGMFQDLIEVGSAEAKAYEHFYNNSLNAYPYFAIKPYVVPLTPQTLNVTGAPKSYYIVRSFDTRGFGMNAQFQQKLRKINFEIEAHQIGSLSDGLQLRIATLASVLDCNGLDDFLSSKIIANNTDHLHLQLSNEILNAESLISSERETQAFFAKGGGVVIPESSPNYEAAYASQWGKLSYVFRLNNYLWTPLTARSLGRTFDGIDSIDGMISPLAEPLKPMVGGAFAELSENPLPLDSAAKAALCESLRSYTRSGAGASEASGTVQSESTGMVQ